MTLAAVIGVAFAAGLVALPERVRFGVVERLCLRFLVGVALIAGPVMLVGSFSLAWTRGPMLLLGVLGVLWVIYHVRTWPLPILSPLHGLEWCACAALVFSLALGLLAALAPVTGWDAVVAHLALPSDYARAGRIFLHPGNVYSGYPQMMHSLYALVFYGNGEGGVRLFHWLLSVSACGAVFFLGRQVAKRRAGLLAAALFATAPIFADQVGTVSIDLPFAAFATAALGLFLAWREHEETKLLLWSAFLAGASCGIRHTGYVVCVLLAVGALVWASEKRWRTFLCFGGVAVLGALPWLLRAWALTGNPVFPFLDSVFPSSTLEHIAISGMASHESVSQTGGLEVWGFLRFPWDIIMRPEAFDGWSKSPGGLVLILGIPGLILGGRRCRELGLYAGAGLACFYVFQRLARYMLPFFIPMMVVAAVAESRMGRLRKPAAALLLLSFAYGLALHGAGVHFKVRAALGLESREAYLERRIERYPAYEYVNALPSKGGVVLCLDQRSYFIERPSYQNHWALKKIALQDVAAQRVWLVENGISYVLYPVEFVANSGAIAADVGGMIEGWKKDEAHFSVNTILETPAVRGGAREHVEIIEVRHD